jgi:2-succinyl-6-hydroxy-2,4-cyclohexadiene-1-carboxylate synthase
MGFDRPLVLLHGLFGGPTSFEPVLAEMHSRFQAFCPTLSYHEAATGLHTRLQDRSKGETNEVSFLDEVDRLAARVMTEFSEKPVTLVGYSLGGRIALSMAIRHAPLVRKLVLISSRRGLDTPSEREARVASDDGWARRLEHSGFEGFFEAWWAQPVFASLARLPDAVLERETRARQALDPKRLATALRRFSLGVQPDYRGEVRRLSVPTLLVVGGLDTKFVALSHELAGELPNGRTIVVENAGHHLLLEAPAALARIMDPIMDPIMNKETIG